MSRGADTTKEMDRRRAVVAKLDIPLVLLIGGLDPSGGAGLAADIRTVSALGGHPAPVLSAQTVQTAWELRSSIPADPDVLEAQMAAVFETGRPDAVKIGLAGGARIAERIASVLAREAYEGPVVLDPVLAAGSGASVLDEDGRRALETELIPWATVVTPNRPEAEALAGIAVTDDDSARRAAERIVGLGARHVVVKGGHGSGDADDWWFDGRTIRRLSGPRLPVGNVRGTGCVFASALAASLAAGLDMMTALTRAKAYVTRTIEESIACGPTRLGRPPAWWGTKNQTLGQETE